MSKNNFYKNRIYPDLFKYYILDYFPRNKAINQFIKDNFSNKESIEVLDGPFKGLKYPSSKSHGSAFTPKILGTYEKEIENIVLKLLKKEYDLLIDVGCAEGYYAVGFAKYGNVKTVLAYDTSSIARDLCEKMSTLNKVADKVEIRTTFNEVEFKDLLEKFKGKKILIILDVEGSEFDLLKFIVPEIDSNIDILVEIHDLFNFDITSSINHLIKGLNISKFFSLDDFQRAIEYAPSYVKNLSFMERFYLLWEGRPHQMKWYFITKNK